MQDLSASVQGSVDAGGLPGGDVANATYESRDPCRASRCIRNRGDSYSSCSSSSSNPDRRPEQQGNDIGSSYRSAIFYLDDEQRRVAEDTIADVEASGLWPGKVVTEVTPAGPFWEAEPEHQDYLERYPNGYTCHFPRPGWVLPHRSVAAR